MIDEKKPQNNKYNNKNKNQQNIYDAKNYDINDKSFMREMILKSIKQIQL